MSSYAGAPYDFTEPYTYQEAIIRGNIIRHTDDAVDDNVAANSIGIFAQSVKSLIVENNLITLKTSYPRLLDNSEINFLKCKSVKSFNNAKMNGTLLVPYDRTNQRHVDELEIDAEDWILTYLTKK